MVEFTRNGKKRVVVTGMGAITPLGESVQAFWDGLVAGRSGIGRMTLTDPSAYPCQVAGEVKGWDPDRHIDKRESRRMARFSQLAVAATHEATRQARLSAERIDSTRFGVVFGNGNGGFPNIDEAMRTVVTKGGMRMSPFFFPMALPNMAAANISRLFGAHGISNTIVTACAASTQSVGEAAEVIRRGAADVVITGGAEAGISELGLAGFAVMRALASSHNDDPPLASRPFDADRDGFVPAEGAGILIVESLEHALRRGAPVLAEVVGYGASSDAHHQFQPDEDGAGAARAMRWALDDAGVGPREIDYINAHGTSTPLNDASETAAIKRVFGDFAYKVPISSTKSMIGHALGGAGGMEAIASVQTILTGVMHPTVNYQKPDPACELDYVPNVARRKPVRTVLSNSFGFGGQNACLVFRAFDE
ncbi:MAG: beta-ketoacyl-ACP synthase II [SAR202 cluster bacterium]|nr:beta-ketoacyl-ACP synthase II [SAR202 cluster bacterium]